MKRPLFLALHRYIGLFTGIFFLITAVTGGLMLYKNAILYAWYPVLKEARPGAEAAMAGSAEALLSTLWERREEEPLRWVRYPEAGWPFFTVTYLSGELAYFSPTGEKLVASHGYENPVTLIFDIHHHWLMGDAGEKASGYVHLTVLLLLGLGIYAWWPRSWAKSLHLALRGSAIKVNYSWHRVIGAVTSLLMLLAVTTGVGMVFYTQVQSVLLAVFGGEVRSISRTVTPGEQALEWSPLHLAIKETLPEGRIRLISFPAAPDQALSVRKRMPDEWHQNGRSFIYINPYTAQAFAANNAMDEGLGLRLTHKIYPLHSAGVGGGAYTIVLAIAGFAPLVLVPTGFYIWWWRRRRICHKEKK